MAADRRRRGGKSIKDRLGRLEELLPPQGQLARICALMYQDGRLVKLGRDDGTSEPYTGQAIPRAGVKAYVGFDPWARPEDGGV